MGDTAPADPVATLLERMRRSRRSKPTDICDIDVNNTSNSSSHVADGTEEASEKAVAATEKDEIVVDSVRGIDGGDDFTAVGTNRSDRQDHEHVQHNDPQNDAALQEQQTLEQDGQSPEGKKKDPTAQGMSIHRTRDYRDSLGKSVFDLQMTTLSFAHHYRGAGSSYDEVNISPASRHASESIQRNSLYARSSSTNKPSNNRGYFTHGGTTPRFYPLTTVCSKLFYYNTTSAAERGVVSGESSMQRSRQRSPMAGRRGTGSVKHSFNSPGTQTTATSNYRSPDQNIFSGSTVQTPRSVPHYFHDDNSWSSSQNQPNNHVDTNYHTTAEIDDDDDANAPAEEQKKKGRTRLTAPDISHWLKSINV